MKILISFDRNAFFITLFQVNIYSGTDPDTIKRSSGSFLLNYIAFSSHSLVHLGIDTRGNSRDDSSDH